MFYNAYLPLLVDAHPEVGYRGNGFGGEHTMALEIALTHVAGEARV